MDNIIFKRRSLRKFLDKKVEKEKVELILKAAMISPTACNQREWEFIVIDDKEILEKLSEATPYSSCVKSAPLAIVPVANRKLMKTEDYWQQDLGAACENILLEAVECGLGGVWIGIAPKEEKMKKVSDVLNIPEDVLPFSIMAIGYSPYELSERDNYEESKVHYNKY